MKDLDLSHNRLTSVPADLIHSMNLLNILDLRDNEISELDRDFFKNGEQIQFVQIGGNRLKSLPNLSPMPHIIAFNASDNLLSRIEAGTFKDQPVMDSLDLSRNQISHMDTNAFPMLNDLKILSLSYNVPLREWVLPNNAFPFLSELYLEGNPDLLQVPLDSQIPLVNELHFTYAYHCCIWDDYIRDERENITVEEGDELIVKTPRVDPLEPPERIEGCLTNEDIEELMKNLEGSNYYIVVDNVTCHFDIVMRPNSADSSMTVESFETVQAMISTRTGFQIVPTYRQSVRCTPPKDPFTPCTNLLEPWVLRLAIWAVWVLALLGNGCVLFIGIASRDKLEATEILICALAVADIMMAVYLAFLAIVDIRTYGSPFFQSALNWQLGSGCKAAGFIAIFSSELSVYLLVMLTLERVYTVSTPSTRTKGSDGG